MRTPWGNSQRVAQLTADGIKEVSTAGHGGYRVPKKVLATIPESLWPRIVTKDGVGWYEEDVECYMLFMVRTDVMKQLDHEKVVAQVMNWFPDQFEAYCGFKPSRHESRVIADRCFAEENARNYVAVSASGDWHPRCPKGFVLVTATLGGGRTRIAYDDAREFLVTAEDYECKGPYVIKDTDVEVKKAVA